MNHDPYAEVLHHEAPTAPFSNAAVSVEGWMAFAPNQDGYEEVREITVVDKPVVLRAHNLPEGVSICLVTFRDSGDCTKGQATPVHICGKPLCLTCRHNHEILAVPGRYAPVVDGERDDFVYLEEQKVSLEMGQLAIQQLTCCCP